MENNKLTQRLLVEGWTPDRTPPGMRPYNQFYGGWEYTHKTLTGMVFETPCGLLVKGSEFVGAMGYMGINWMPENDNPVLCCPRFDLPECSLNHPLLNKMASGVRQCAAHPTGRNFDYERSVERVRKQNDAEADRLYKDFAAKRGGQSCRIHCRYDRWLKEWRIRYDPRQCQCTGGFCPVLQKEIDPRKGNVYYDVRISRTIPGEGLFPPEQKTVITKGLKLFEKQRAITICEAAAKVCRLEIQHREEMRRHSEMFFDKSMTVEVINLRAERRESRDLTQDLRDIAAGIEVIHQSDSLKKAKEQKRECRERAKTARRGKLERQIAAGTLDERDRFRVERMFTPEEIRSIKAKAQEAAHDGQTALW